MDIGERIKEVRKYRRMTQQELADGVGVKKAIISLYESNQRKPSFIRSPISIAFLLVYYHYDIISFTQCKYKNVDIL